ncbi:uncharacterized protein RCO7_11033 [Rhynchosporium graminicola]|uniref:FAD-binding domain-containing protein n=1 Tax=Rhynchosporium graminicola TaxID=2792576 RepID=A0A1E1KVT7_9HELO|nr:uncharacterized protein RCO7_11033 [Rhynchosporium commune]
MPYMAQGATQAIEDAAVLTGCLARAQSLNDISRLSKAYEDIRKPRAEKIKATSLGNMKQYGLPDGPEQEERDEMYRKSHLPVSESTKEILVSKPDNNAVYGSPAFLLGYICTIRKKLCESTLAMRKNIRRDNEA